MNSYRQEGNPCQQIVLVSLYIWVANTKELLGVSAPWTTYMANVAADLTTRHQKVQCCHPLLGAKPGLSGKVMEMRHEARHEVLEPRIFALGVDQVSVWGDVVNREI